MKNDKRWQWQKNTDIIVLRLILRKRIVHFKGADNGLLEKKKLSSARWDLTDNQSRKKKRLDKSSFPSPQITENSNSKHKSVSMV